MTTRRNMLKGLSAGALSAAALGTMQTALGSFTTASAADTTGYKALVCVFLYGGLDSYDWLIPYDQNSYNDWATIRADIVNDWANVEGGNTRARDRLLALNAENAGDFGTRQFALTEEMAGLHGLFENGNAALVGNVGPLIFPTTRAQVENESIELPKKLFSHNDQQSTWMASAPEGAQFGWGGLFADAASASGANATQDFSVMTTLGSELFLSGEDTRPFAIQRGGTPSLSAIDAWDWLPSAPDLRAHFGASRYGDEHLLSQDVTDVTKRSYDLNNLYNDTLNGAMDIAVEFPRNSLGRQLEAVAQAISIRDQLSNSRQVFMVGIGGFDTHDNQAATLSRKLREINDGMVAFYSAMDDMGLGQDVTAFTMSDFGRALAPNGDGTDHGWGAHHIVLGGAVTGKTIYGQVPPASFGHDQDAGNGRLIPTTSVEQFAEPLGRWFGLNDSELAKALPNFDNFDSQKQMMSMLRRAS